jgi:hypothetical protein
LAAAIVADVRVVPSDRTTLFRVYRRGGPHPTNWNTFRFYGPLSGRFDPQELPPRLQERGVLYAATLPDAALAEFFQTRRTINTRHHQPWLVGFTLLRELRLLDLTGLWPTRDGASMAISSGPRPRARAWARAIYDAYPEIEGVWYGSSMHASTPCVALFERAGDALAPPARFSPCARRRDAARVADQRRRRSAFSHHRLNVRRAGWRIDAAPADDVANASSWWTACHSPHASRSGCSLET